MKKELSPAVIIGVVLVAVVLLGFFGYRMMQAPGYYPSPGAGGRPSAGGLPGATASNPSASSVGPSTPTTYYPAAPEGSIPGKPAASGGRNSPQPH